MRRSVNPVCQAILPLAAVLLVTALILPGAWAQQAPRYMPPPKAIQDVLNAPATPLLSLSPTREWAMLAEPVRYPPIADLAQPMLRLAGSRINPATNGPHTPQRIVSLTLKRVSDGSERKLATPAGGLLGGAQWSRDGKRFAFTNTTALGIELWAGEAETAKVWKIAGVVLNAAFGAPIEWMPDNRTLLCRTVPARRGPPPVRPAVPVGPHIEESYGRPSPVPTFQDMLQDTYDEALYDYYATSQLVLVDTAGGKTTPFGQPAIYSTLDPAPDGQHFLIVRIVRPYSYLVPAGRFPRQVEVWDRSAKAVHKVASVPLGDNIPIGGVQKGPRGYHWRPTDPATLVWIEALDDGDPRKRVPHRDHILWLKAPFTGQPAELLKTEHRLGGLEWGERGDLALVRDFDRNTLRLRTWFFNPNHPAETMKLAWDMSSQERYNNPGTPVMRFLPTGQAAMLQDGDFIYLSGAGSTPEGDRPFLDRLDTKTLKSERLFRSDDKSYESFVALLATDGSKFMTRYETPTEPPNYMIRSRGSDARTAFTSFPDPAPQLRGIKKELVKYKRADGVDLSFTLYLPPGYKQGERRPALVWAYPLEFTSADVAGQVSGSPNRFTTIGGISHLFLLLQGYVVLDNATMPVVGDPETVNNTYVEQIVASARAAVDKAAEMGVVDPNRVGVGGHSYGAFMTANLLVHSDIFRAGIARSGAYNRTLTPFGFQSERRTLWQATETYMKMSPFLHAQKLNEPILLIHGEADNNSGTFPIQSERMYQAVKGNGGQVRYVTLPYESHGYSARESIGHTLWEMINWMDTHVKNAGPRQQMAGTEEARKQ